MKTTLNNKMNSILSLQANSVRIVGALRHLWLETEPVVYCDLRTNVWFQKISVPYPWMAFHFDRPPPNPSGNSGLALYFSSKNLAFETPHPLGIAKDHPQCGYRYFLEPHNHHSLVTETYHDCVF